MRIGKITMNYIEELVNGDTFLIKEERFIASTDFKKNGSRLCISLDDGSHRWFGPSEIINKISVYYIDNDNNIVPIKEHKQ